MPKLRLKMEFPQYAKTQVAPAIELKYYNAPSLLCDKVASTIWHLEVLKEINFLRLGKIDRTKATSVAWPEISQMSHRDTYLDVLQQPAHPLLGFPGHSIRARAGISPCCRPWPESARMPVQQVPSAVPISRAT